MINKEISLENGLPLGIFEMFDVGNKGYLTFDEFNLFNIFIRKRIQEMNIFDLIFNLADDVGAGTLDLQQFISVWRCIDRNINIERLKTIFNEFTRNSGVVNLEQYKMLNELVEEEIIYEKFEMDEI